jgi:tetratricopeptide (TPR) repeat protein
MADVVEHGEGSLTQKISDFIQRNRGGFLTGLIGIVAALVIFIAVTSIRDSINTKTLTQVEELSGRYDILRFDINDTSKDADIQALIDDCSNFAINHKGYAGARAYSIVGSIYMDKKNWTEAVKAWNNAAAAGAGTYLEPVSIYRAAVAAEEQNNYQEAIDLYTKAAAMNFPAAARAQFAIGRIQETQNNKDAALEAYRSLLSKWPNDGMWSNFAQSRIIALTIK